VSQLPVAVSAFQINDGSAQRSMIDSLTVTFTQPVTLGSGAITLNQLSQTGGASTPMSFSLSSPDGGTTWVLTFTDPSYIGHSLPDGAYALTITGSAVSNSLGQTMAGTTTENFWRLYGDFEGTGRVDATDFGIFAPLFGQTVPSNLWYVDYNGDGKLDATDFGAFAPNFGQQIVIPSVQQPVVAIATSSSILTPAATPRTPAGTSKAAGSSKVNHPSSVQNKDGTLHRRLRS